MLHIGRRTIEVLSFSLHSTVLVNRYVIVFLGPPSFFSPCVGMTNCSVRFSRFVLASRSCVLCLVLWLRCRFNRRFYSIKVISSMSRVTAIVKQPRSIPVGYNIYHLSAMKTKARLVFGLPSSFRAYVQCLHTLRNGNPTSHSKAVDQSSSH